MSTYVLSVSSRETSNLERRTYIVLIHRLGGPALDFVRIDIDFDGFAGFSEAVPLHQFGGHLVIPFISPYRIIQEWLEDCIAIFPTRAGISARQEVVRSR